MPGTERRLSRRAGTVPPHLLRARLGALLGVLGVVVGLSLVLWELAAVLLLSLPHLGRLALGALVVAAGATVLRRARTP